MGTSRQPDQKTDKSNFNAHPHIFNQCANVSPKEFNHFIFATLIIVAIEASILKSKQRIRRLSSEGTNEAANAAMLAAQPRNPSVGWAGTFISQARIGTSLGLCPRV